MELTPQQVKALYFDEKSLIESPKKLYRWQRGGQRYYYSLENFIPKFYIGVTTLIKNSIPTSEFLIKWTADMGYDEAKRYANERAEYGTFLHTLCAYLLIDKRYNLDTLEGELILYCAKNNIPSQKVDDWIEDLQKDLLSFAQMCIDINLKPLAIEIPLCSTLGFAGAVDIIAEIDYIVEGYFGEFYKSGVNKDKPKLTKKIERQVAIIDIKSGRKGFYDSAKFQLGCYEKLVRENFSQFNDTPLKFFNWSPKEWRTAPTYNFIEQTDKEILKKLDLIIELGTMDVKSAESKNKLTLGGVIDLTTNNITSNYININIIEYLAELHNKTITETVTSKFDELTDKLPF
jgi:hypothetical protein